MNKAKIAEKPAWAPNEAPLSRWVAFFIAGMVAMSFAQAIFLTIMELWKMDGVWTWLPGTLCPLLGFVLTYVLLGLLCKKICKTTLRELILGAGNEFDTKLCIKMCVGTAVGFALQFMVCAVLFPSPGATTQLNTIGAVPIIVNFVLCLALLWMQTTAEEILFRCPFLRAGGGDKLVPSARVALGGVVSCAIFMAMHGSNPEVTSQGDVVAVVTMLAGYLIAAVGMYVADVVYGSCLAGCAIHWANNFINFALVCQAGSAVESGSVFWTAGAVSGPAGLVGTICLFVPVVLIMVVDVRKRRAAVQ